MCGCLLSFGRNKSNKQAYGFRKVEMEIDCVLKMFQLISISFQWAKRRIELSHIDIIKMIRKLNKLSICNNYRPLKSMG